MDLSAKLGSLATSSSTPRVQLVNYTRQEGYSILELKSLSTRYGRAIVMTFLDEVGERKCAFLPKRFTEQLDDKECAELSKAGCYRFRCAEKLVNGSPELHIYKI